MISNRKTLFIDEELFFTCGALKVDNISVFEWLYYK